MLISTYKGQRKNAAKFILIILIPSIIAVVIFRYYHPTHYKYNERFIIGNTANEIVERYGEFDHVFKGSDNLTIRSGGYLIAERKAGLFGSSAEKYYMIYFDENSVAEKTDVVTGGWGG